MHSMTLLLLAALPVTLAFPTQLTFGGAPKFPSHTLLPLNDGTFIPSPAFGSGSAFFQQNVTQNIIDALGVGYRHLDNSAIYGNQKSVGEGIKKSGIAREELYITSKFDNMNRDGDVESELNQTLADLGVDYLDLYLIHFPAAAQPSPESVWRSFESFVERGLVKSIGISNYDHLEDLQDLLSFAKIIPAVNQIRYHPYNQLSQLPSITLGKTHKILTACYSSLTPLTKEPGGSLDPVLGKIAEKEGITEGQVILDWIKEKEFLTVTTSGKIYRMQEQLDVFGENFPELTQKEVIEFEKAGVKGELKNK